MLNPGAVIGYEFSSTLKIFENEMPRRSKRKASALATQKNAELASASAADASATTVEKTASNGPEDDSVQVEDLTDDEESLHGPCNTRPVGADENPRFVHR